MRLSRNRFEALVAEGVARIPKKFLDYLENVAVLVEDEPSKETLRSVGITGPGETLYGLYEGVSHAAGGHYHRSLPDRIIIYQRPIEENAESEEEVREMVADTVWHEIAHHLGMDEGEVRAAEHRRKVK